MGGRKNGFVLLLLDVGTPAEMEGGGVEDDEAVALPAPSLRNGFVLLGFVGTGDAISGCAETSLAGAPEG